MVEETPWQQVPPLGQPCQSVPVLRRAPQDPGGAATGRHLRRQHLSRDRRAAPRPAGQLGCHEAPGGDPGRGRVGGGLRRRSAQAVIEPNIITETRPSTIEHRRLMMRHFGPPHSPRMICRPGARDPPPHRRAPGQDEGQDPDRRRRRVRLPAAGDRDLRDPGRATATTSRASTPGSKRPWTASTLARRRPPRSNGAWRSKSLGEVIKFRQYPGRPDRPVRQAARPGHALGDWCTTTARTDECPRARSSATPCCMLFAGHETTVNLIAHSVLCPAAAPRPAREAAPPTRADRARRSRSCCASSRRSSSGTPAPRSRTSRSRAPPSRRARRSSWCTARRTATRSGSRTRTSSTSNARTTSTSASARASTTASAPRSRGSRSRSRSASSSVAWRTRGSSSTRRRTATTRSSAARATLLVDIDGIRD